jgi:Activator of Hsp90 ATPase homolog 1-like protein
VAPTASSRGPPGYEIDNGGTVDEVAAPERLVTRQDAGAGRTRHTLVLTEGGGSTRMTYIVEYPTTEIARRRGGDDRSDGTRGTNKLAEYLRTMA